ncbi:MAG TPA: orotidine-5'-phosphate decarboxylase [Melioribacteraceae bacterium]|nr:orotidine-5'-phosphate decarboxylase [Melioribacteraceae bacterium]
MDAREKLQKVLDENKHICIGLDTDENKIPDYLKGEKNALQLFNKIIIENTYEQVAAYKLNFAFYERMGTKGFEILEETLSYIPSKILTIGDAKRGDIGNTCEMYADAIFNKLNFDSVTLNPYMGYDSVEPFLKFKDKINFILVLTSNKSSNDFEKLKLENGNYLFQQVLNSVNNWNVHNNCGIVFGATNLEELKNNCDNFNNLFVLLPGVGAQGGSLEEVTRLFKLNKNNNYLVNISRALIYCENSTKFPKIISETLKNYNKIAMETSR